MPVTVISPVKVKFCGHVTLAGGATNAFAPMTVNGIGVGVSVGVAMIGVGDKVGVGVSVGVVAGGQLIEKVACAEEKLLGERTWIRDQPL